MTQRTQIGYDYDYDDCTHVGGYSSRVALYGPIRGDRRREGLCMERQQTGQRVQGTVQQTTRARALVIPCIGWSW